MNAENITRQSKSNLALAFVALDRRRRADITTFYAFCRLVDDIADSSELSVAEKAQGLASWRESLRGGRAHEPELAPAIRRLMAKYPISPEMLEEIIAGVEMDLSTTRYATFADLRVYCYRVASAVGLVSIEIFGYRNPRCRDYAVELGLALQTTNIIRDVGKDLASDRIYLPLEDLDRSGYREADLQARVYDSRFIELMEFQTARSRDFFAKATAALPREDRRSMMAAEIMSAVYRSLLRRMEQDRFRVFEKEYRLNRLQKAAHVASQLLRFK